MGTRNEILEKLAMKTAENEKEIDLNETSISAATSKSKKDLSKSLIANLDNEFETLKFKRSAVMAVIYIELSSSNLTFLNLGKRQN